MSLSEEDTLQKSSSSTTIPDFSEICTSISNSKHEEIQNLKQKLENFRQQIFVKNEAIDNKEKEKEGIQKKLNFLQTACDRLLNNLPDEENFTDKNMEMYLEHVNQMGAYCTHLKAENGQLKQRLLMNDTKISSILHENSYLRWENEQFIIEMESLREKLDAEFLKTKELKAEIRCLQVNQKQINQIHSARLKEECISVRDSNREEIQFFKNLLEDKDTEQRLEISRLQNKIDFITQESARKENFIKKLTSTINNLNDENKELYKQFNDLKQTTEKEIDRLYNRESELEAQLQQTHENLAQNEKIDQNHEKIENLIFFKGVQHQKDLEVIENLRQQVHDLTALAQTKNDTELKHLYNQKRIPSRKRTTKKCHYFIDRNEQRYENLDC
uniref:Uncharacterized protein n=2 Tax=Acrobeloides nanus TaxID=290746 RepID=A0A914DVQ8_9BILA